MVAKMSQICIIWRIIMLEVIKCKYKWIIANVENIINFLILLF